MLSRSAEYALRAVLYLAEHPGAEPVRAPDAARALGIPANYLSKILHTLGRAGVVVSERGRHGGFRLAVAPEHLTLVQVVEPFEELGSRRTCLLGRPECSDGAPCAVHERWKEVSERLLAFFQQTTVGDLLREGPRSARSTRA